MDLFSGKKYGPNVYMSTHPTEISFDFLGLVNQSWQIVSPFQRVVAHVETWAPRGLLFSKNVFFKGDILRISISERAWCYGFHGIQKPQLKQFTFLFWKQKFLFVKVISFRCFLDLSFHRVPHFCCCFACSRVFSWWWVPPTVKDFQVEEQKEAFDVLDSDGNGKITFQEVKANLTVGVPPPTRRLVGRKSPYTEKGNHGHTPHLCPENMQVL